MESVMIKVTRFAPSPTGTLHIGGVRTALFNFVYSKQQKGKFLIRIEDTDAERSTREFEENILKGLADMGIVPDETPVGSQKDQIYTKMPLVKSWILGKPITVIVVRSV